MVETCVSTVLHSFQTSTDMHVSKESLAVKQNC